MRHSQNFDKINSFRKPVLNIFIVGNLIVGWGEGVLKEGLVFCIKSIELKEVLIIGGNRIHQSKSWYYLGPSQTSKVDFFCGNCFRLLAVNFFCKKLQLRCLISSIRRFQKTLFMFS